jgi:enterochelin esterase-like enzyme
MKRTLSLCLLLLAACRPVTPLPSTPPPFACETPGTVDYHTMPLEGGSVYVYGLYLPPCYGRDPERAYPVLYLLPGKNGSPDDWFQAGAGEAADELILHGEVPPFIIVTTQDGTPDVTTGQLIPFIAGKYRVSPERRLHVIAGGSMGGAYAYRIAFQHPDLFAAVGFFGSGSYPGEEDRTRAWLAAIPPVERPRLFLNAGLGEDDYMVGRSRVMMQIAGEYGMTYAHIFTRGNHSYEYWMKAMPCFMHWMALDW